MTYKIEKNKKMPKSTKGRKPKYPFGTMAVGDSFKIPTDIYIKVAMSAYQYGRRNNMRFSIKKENDDTINCWRTE